MGLDASKRMLEQWAIFLAVLWVPLKKHLSVYEGTLMSDAVEEVNAYMQAQVYHTPTIPEALIQIIKTESNKSCRQVFTSEITVR